MCISKIIEGWKKNKEMNNSLEKIVHEIKTETDSLKASQIIGFDNSVIYQYEYEISKTLTSYSTGYTFTFTGTQAFPLMVISLQIYENGTLKPNPYDMMYSYYSSEYSSMNSLLSYTLSDCNTWFSSGFVPPVKPPNIIQQSLDINKRGGSSATVSFRIVATIRVTCPGYVTITEGITD